MYELKKISIMDGKDSMVGPGYKSRSNYLAIYLAGKHPPEEILSIKGIRVGWQVLIGGGFNHLNTSPITEIIGEGRDKIKFRTQTSIYELKKVKDID